MLNDLSTSWVAPEQNPHSRTWTELVYKTLAYDLRSKPRPRSIPPMEEAVKIHSARKPDGL
jgi:hypothetical protein